MNPVLDRRTMLRRAVLAAGTFALSGCASSAADPRRLVPVRARRERVIRSLAGLRPFRPSGFVVRADRFDDTVVVHNYGHGGGGISLCWGSSALAVDLAQETGRDRFAVLGCGALGLTTARLLQDRGYAVTIYAKDLPPHTTSNIAGGHWSPFTVSERGRTTPAHDAQFERAARLAHRQFQNLTGGPYGVRWLENYVLSDTPLQPNRSAIADLFFDSEDLPPAAHPFDAPHVRRFTTMLIEPGIFLDTLMRDFLLRGGRVVVREFAAVRDVVSLEETAIVNCMGLGSRTLFNDEELVPLRGQLAVLLPQPEVDYVVLAGDHYMFPRSDGIVLGGTREADQWSTEPVPETIDAIVSAHARIFAAMR